MILKGILVIPFIFLLIHCKGTQHVSELQKNDDVSLTAPIQQTDVTIYPDDARVDTTISLQSNGYLIIGSEIRWYINDMRDDSAHGLRFSSDSLKAGDSVKAVVLRNGKEYNSNTIVIRNSPPTIVSAEISPPKPRADSTLTVLAEASDADNDRVFLRYKWKVNDEILSDKHYLNTGLKRGDSLSVEITPYDSEDFGRAVIIKRSVLNSLPSFAESDPSFDGTMYRYQVTATDPDNDTLTYKIEQGPEGMQIDPATGLITWEVTPEDYGYHEIKVVIDDNNGGQLIVPFSTKLQSAEES